MNSASAVLTGKVYIYIDLL